jgi:hypothetical protein
MIPQELIQKTREWFRDNALACIQDAESGITPVNDLDSYRVTQTEFATEVMRGDYDGSFAFRQLATYFATGESRPLL